MSDETPVIPGLWLGNLDRQLTLIITDETITVTHQHGPDEVLATKHVVEIKEWYGVKKESKSMAVLTDQRQNIIFLGDRPEIAQAIGPRAGLHRVYDADTLIHWVR